MRIHITVFFWMYYRSSNVDCCVVGYREGVTWVEGDAQQLPFQDNSFDAYTIAFGIRSVKCTFHLLADIK